ncbi:hypothetical protein [Chitinophaga sancti]|uniref:YXWGXW repeat-containing protein n=2 Tax=Chitinophaga sancti TaxID=1004 RepID=A0A1K1SRP3_9BACT|nr:hypothetical protein [Chitinophaga sancti]WQD65306.1 hypothetical protein U0033_12965 [Chitinophaga sancti]WQG89070.1 hypothetical protein SR876_29505 [Chitinophaga sancti]SFW86958.1 hypothetical protein SAMN05661012_05999 [Chitinophaga sancti]
MKKIVLITCLVAIGSIYSYKADAQVRFNVNVNIGSQPAWGPEGYDYAEYYYMPDIDAYYYVPERQFIYLEDSRWVFAPALPPRFHYDLYRGYKVVVNEPRPYLRPEFCRDRFAGYRGAWGRQSIIRDSRNPRYFAAQPHGGGYYGGRGYEGGRHGWNNGGERGHEGGGWNGGGPGWNNGGGRGHEGGGWDGGGRGHEGGNGRGGDHGRHGH